MARYYAQIDGAGLCFAVSQLSGEVDAPNLIEIDSLDTEFLGKRYDARTGAWTAAEEGR